MKKDDELYSGEVEVAEGCGSSVSSPLAECRTDVVLSHDRAGACEAFRDVDGELDGERRVVRLLMSLNRRSTRVQ